MRALEDYFDSDCALCFASDAALWRTARMDGQQKGQWRPRNGAMLGAASRQGMIAFQCSFASDGIWPGSSPEQLPERRRSGQH